MNCVDNNCKNLYTISGEYYCAITHKEIPEFINVLDSNEKSSDCDNFVQAHTCLNCKHSKTTVYETGTIDDIEYRCPFQENKLIYDDSTAPWKTNIYRTNGEIQRDASNDLGSILRFLPYQRG